MTFLSPELLLLSIALAYVADLLLGDPMWLPHPVVGFGKMVSSLEKRMNRGKYLLVKGLAIAVLSIGLVYGLFFVMDDVAQHVGTIAYVLFTVVALFFVLAIRTLIHEGRMVFDQL